MNNKNYPSIIISTAHPAKFSDSVKKALGFYPNVPEKLLHALALPENYIKLDNKVEVVRDYIENNVIEL